MSAAQALFVEVLAVYLLVLDRAALDCFEMFACWSAKALNCRHTVELWKPSDHPKVIDL